MPGNREAYEQAMNAGHSAAWDQNWKEAANYYARAVQEFSEDPEAHIHLGLALLNSERLEEALRVYKRAHQLAPDDPIPLEKSADVLERMGRLKEAAQQYVNVAEVYLAQRDLSKAMGNWERATQLTPGLTAIHGKLAQAYERIGDNKKAIREYLKLASAFQVARQTDNAIRAVERALKLDKKNPQALNTLRALQSGGQVILEDYDEADSRASAAQKALGGSVRSDGDRKDEDDADALGPMGEAMNEALGLLASYIMESSDMDTIGDVMQAMEAQRQGINDQALAAYQRADARMRHPALKMNLGGLLLLNDHADEATKHLGEAITAPELQAGALHALGWAYHAANKPKTATKNLVRAMQEVDMASGIAPDEAEDLSSFYTQLNKTLADVSDDELRKINEDRFLKWLGGQGWRTRLVEARRHMQEISSRDGWQGVRDFLGAGGSDALTEAVSNIDRYMRQALLVLAMDEAHRAVQISPTYLPVHVRMAEIMMREGRVRQAINKYNTVAKLYLVRGEKDRAASILGEVLEMAPLDVPVRQNLIELLEEEQRWPDVLEQYIGLANTYQQLGNFDQSRETFVAAERLGRRSGAAPEKLAQIKHHIADIDQMKLDTRKAMKTYEEITEILPTDERAQKALVELYYAQGNQLDALKRLDVLLSIYAKNKQVNRITQMLEDLVKRYPNDHGLRTRMSTIYQHLGRTKDAIAQLDALGELQLEAGAHDEAVKTIRRIIELGPTNIEDYRRLLSQLGG
ncbi:MAG: tetratricopeptide repeat protein [Chloroflexi bacterium]|nr:tetratricopeptide repeat protein [Chloroflexota bacterium]